ncbi:hypothetical protein ARMGADRAFT_1019020 [Armillaria gallica]|uniref:Uncharacterized protein n=1 Tax=Armillaria gallica TaxID=47427 RepID=A0A2H3D548_ARMGA|nr:hypothetical protein ARMGADRAFT_1019020 [Armillaria gallica]
MAVSSHRMVPSFAYSQTLLHHDIAIAHTASCREGEALKRMYEFTKRRSQKDQARYNRCQ